MFLFLSSLIFSGYAFAAACCGGGFAAPALIVGDDAGLLTASYARTRIADDIGADALWRPRDVSEISQTYKVDAAHLIADQWQVGLSVPLVERSRAEGHSTGLGDIAGSLGYEYLPDWDYNPWRPRGLGFLQVTLPTGRSIDEADALYQLDSRGRGFWALGLGTILTKTIGLFDGYGDLDIHRSFSKYFANSQESGRLEPGWGGNASVGGGFNWRNFRLGVGLQWSYEDPINVIGPISTNGSFQRFATGTASLSYLVGTQYSATLTYADQTVFGSPSNTTLGRGVTLALQKRWAR